MLSIEQAILPRLLPFPIPAPVEGAVSRLLGLDQFGAVYAGLREMGDERSISERLLHHLEVTHRVSEKDLAQVPRKRPAVLVVNHPFGILEGAVLTTMLSPLRPDVRFLANGVLATIPELRDLIIPVNPMGDVRALRSNPGGLRESLRFLAAGGLLVIFPAGEVSHFQWKQGAITDPPWSPGIARILAIAARVAPGLSVVPVHVQGSNSLLFQFAGMLHPRLRTALLARELLNKRRAHVAARIGSAIPADKLLAIPTNEERIRYLRWRTYLLASRSEYKPRTGRPLPVQRARVRLPVAAPVSQEALIAEVSGLPTSCQLARSGDLCAYLATADRIPSVLAEIGRLREVTFRAAGEGTGKSTDLDEFDAHYLHLFIWNEAKGEVMGAYRLAPVDRVRERLGLRGLYTATLFQYGDGFLDRLGPALELGRSFIRAEYQRSFAPLLLLWKGIGRYVSGNPRYRVLFGPVSISNQYQSISRELMVSFLERHASLRDWVGLVSARSALRPRHRGRPAALPGSGFDIEDLSDVVSDIEPSRAGVPVLLRQYLKLGGKLLGFNVDPKFADALDGLILVDLSKTERRLLERYLGKREAAAFLAFQKETHETQ